MKNQKTIDILSELETYCHYKSLEVIKKSNLIKCVDKKEKDAKEAEALGELCAYLDIEEKISYKKVKLEIGF